MSKHAFNQAARFFMETVERVRPQQWDDPGLGVWTVRDLTGHTTRALMTAQEYSAKPAARLDIAGPVEYYHRALAAPDINEQIAERGRKTAEQLTDDPAVFVRQLAMERSVPAVNSAPNDAVITTQVGGMRLTDYLLTRVLELTVHTLDLAAATGQQPRPPRDAMAATLRLLADLALDSGHAQELALLATGRGIVSNRFSVLE